MRYSIEMKSNGGDWYWSIVDETNKVVEDSSKHYSFYQAQDAATDAEASRRQWQFKAYRQAGLERRRVQQAG